MSRQSSIFQVNATDGSGRTHLPGVGYVPSGPRADRQSRDSTGGARRSKPPNPVYIKEEEEEGEYIENDSDRPNTATRLHSDMGNNADLDYNSGYLNTFQGLLANYHNDRSSSYRSDSSRRQREFGHQSRESSNAFTRSRTQRNDTVQERGGSDLRFTSGSPMFFPAASDGRGRRGEESTPSPSESSNRPHSIGTDETDDRCACPIGYDCNCRPSMLLDHRPLVRESVPWRERQEQEAYDRQRLRKPLRIRSVSVELLGRICNEVERLKNAHSSREARRNTIAAIRQWILEVVDTNVDEGLPRDCVTDRVIHCLREFLGPNGAAIRQRSPHLPSYIEEELTVLQRKWGRGDFDGAVDRGLRHIETVDVNGTPVRTRMVVDRKWVHFVSPLHFGQGDLVNGQVWYSRAELQRDGVHAPSVAGISGTAAKGARSIVLGEFSDNKNQGYANIDMGDVIEYMGTALPDEEGLGPTNVQDAHMNNVDSWNSDEARKPTIATQAMMRSLETGEPVRVIRSHKMSSIVKNKPTKGYRYDGLYRVTRKTAMKEARQIWSFRLERIAGQGPLRGFDYGKPQPDLSGTRKGHFSRNRREGS